MKGAYLRFYAHENRKVEGLPFYEWLLGAARKLGIQGGTAFKSMAGFGRRGVLHEAKFFELAGDLAVEVEFIVTEEQAAQLVEVVRAAHVGALYAKVAAEFEVLDGEP